MVLRVCLMVLVVAAVAAGVGGSPRAGPQGRSPAGVAPLAHIAGSARKIRMYIKNTYLQLSPDGSVSGAPDDQSHHTVLQRSSVTTGQVKIQGVTTCMYLCMDTCGIPYASKEYTDECVFNEMIEAHHYNSYSSAKYSNSRRTLYLGLNKKGVPRRVQIRGGSLGKLSSFTRVLTQPVTSEEAARAWEGGAGARCPIAPQTSAGTGRCRRPRRRRRKRKRCRDDDEECHESAEGGPRRVPPLLRRRKQHRLRHRKHRTAEELDDPAAEEEFFLFANEDDPSDAADFLDNNESE